MRVEAPKQLGFKYLKVRGHYLVVDNKRSENKSPLTEPKLDAWIERDVEPVFDAAAQVWINSRGSKIGKASGMNMEDYDFEENDARNDLIQELSGSNGYHFTVEEIVESLRKRAKKLEANSNRSGWANAFMLDVIEDLGIARNLSQTRIEALKKDIIQTKLQLKI